MLDFNFSEMAVVALVALVVIGPKDLPKALRVLGYWVGKARGVARQFRAGFDEMVREAELAEMEKKWKEENERIMREHPVLTSAAPEPTQSAPPSDTAPADEEATMVEQPAIVPAPAPTAELPQDKAAS
ncbi:Sec-independent protein translocase protein TatB [Sphingomonas dokdonensis]|uniref:Sec-independent protein translocase protein TatB n=1 Tax=Sphingomonas dokdonensis TaxID=344880 RepID=A0A245ZUR6_9SPHN|nr:Sec-independent protein translocase protein TatB [Sphingomonas dokdonensis]OWK33489.1 Sec-independent protein translocase protein TatB [Sphingomonas dokdonensis]